MCAFESLYWTEYGQVIFCNSCEHYQILFQDNLFILPTEGFCYFLELMRTVCERESASLEAPIANLIIPTPSPHHFLNLTRTEARIFCQMLEAADNEAKTQSLLMLFR